MQKIHRQRVAKEAGVVPDVPHTQAGATASTIIFTILETAKANGLNPEAYLNHILTILPERFSQNHKAAIDDLLPWAQDMRRLFQV